MEDNICLSLSLKQQAKMAEYCRSIFGEALLIDPLDKYSVSNTNARTHTQFQIICSDLTTTATGLSLLCVSIAGVRRPPAQSSGADGQNPHQEQEIAQTLQQRRHQKADGPTCQSEQRAGVT